MISRALCLVAGLAVVLPARADSSQGPGEQDTAVVRWLKDGALPLRGLEPNTGFDDLRPLKKILQGVRVVGVGEATHGTAEFVQLRHRLLEFLVQEMGFTLLAVEFSAADAQIVNDYVQNGKTGQEDLTRCLKKIWITDTQELNAAIHWMRDYNGRVAPERRVKFVGIDPQANARAIDGIQNYLRRVASKRVARAETLFQALTTEDGHAVKFSPTKILPSQLAELYQLLSYLDLHRVDLVRQSSAEEWEQAHQQLRWLTQFAEFNCPGFDSGGTRDGYMAGNLLEALSKEKPGTRCVLWAHNAHVCKRDTGAVPALGSYLRKAFTNEYYVFGVAFDRGSFVAQLPKVQPPKLEVFSLDSAPPRTIDWFLAKVGIGNLVVDLHRPCPDEYVGNWLKTPHALHWIGIFYGASAASSRPFVLNRDFDGLIFVEQSTPPHSPNH